MSYPVSINNMSAGRHRSVAPERLPSGRGMRTEPGMLSSPLARGSPGLGIVPWGDVPSRQWGIPLAPVKRWGILAH
jgi:hypothetical protein